jgi:hypothetical protein
LIKHASMLYTITWLIHLALATSAGSRRFLSLIFNKTTKQ